MAYVYIAGPMFSEAEKEFNLSVEKVMKEMFRTYLPQVDGGTMDQYLKEGSTPEEAVKSMMDLDTKALDECNFLLAILDGPQVDDGTACEIGYIHAKGKLCYGLQTDFRKQQPLARNLFINHCLIKVFNSKWEMTQYFTRSGNVQLLELDGRFQK